MAAPAYGLDGTPSGEVFQLLCACAGVNSKNVQKMSVHFGLDEQTSFEVTLHGDEAKFHQAAKAFQERTFEIQLESLNASLNGRLTSEDLPVVNIQNLSAAKKKWVQMLGSGMTVKSSQGVQKAP